MFAAETRAEGLRVLAKQHVAAGLQAGVHDLRDQSPWASEGRTPELLKNLVSYGAHAQTVVPELERIAADFADGEPKFPRKRSRDKAAAVRRAFEQIHTTTDRPALHPLP
jgi:hypothetical protein